MQAVSCCLVLLLIFIGVLRAEDPFDDADDNGRRLKQLTARARTNNPSAPLRFSPSIKSPKKQSTSLTGPSRSLLTVLASTKVAASSSPTKLIVSTSKAVSLKQTLASPSIRTSTQAGIIDESFLIEETLGAETLSIFSATTSIISTQHNDASIISTEHHDTSINEHHDASIISTEHPSINEHLDDDLDGDMLLIPKVPMRDQHANQEHVANEANQENPPAPPLRLPKLPVPDLHPALRSYLPGQCTTSRSPPNTNVPRTLTGPITTLVSPIQQRDCAAGPCCWPEKDGCSTSANQLLQTSLWTETVTAMETLRLCRQTTTVLITSSTTTTTSTLTITTTLTSSVLAVVTTVRSTTLTLQNRITQTTRRTIVRDALTTLSATTTQLISTTTKTNTLYVRSNVPVFNTLFTQSTITSTINQTEIVTVIQTLTAETTLTSFSTIIVTSLTPSIKYTSTSLVILTTYVTDIATPTTFTLRTYETILDLQSLTYIDYEFTTTVSAVTAPFRTSVYGLTVFDPTVGDATTGTAYYTLPAETVTLAID